MVVGKNLCFICSLKLPPWTFINNNWEIVKSTKIAGIGKKAVIGKTAKVIGNVLNTSSSHTCAVSCKK